jgi:enoyl-CoA hydratase/carnithine racemase
MPEPLVLLEIEGPIALLTLHHPEKRNALSQAMLTCLLERLGELSQRSPQVKVVILRAEGPVFSSGHDLRELIGRAEEEYTAIFQRCTDVMEGLRQLPQPVIAQVQGLATAAGCQLVASCDLVVAAENATFATPGVKIGLFCTTPAVALCRAVPARKALEMLFTGNPITAHEAERYGLVNRVVAPERLAAETLALARQISTASAVVLKMGKRAFYEQLPLPRPDAYRLAQPVMVCNSLVGDAQEGMRAFLEKRQPQWEADRGTLLQGKQM